jgi:hypothetical protein
MRLACAVRACPVITEGDCLCTLLILLLYGTNAEPRFDN